MTAKGETISTPYTYTDFSNGTSQSTSALTSILIVTSNYDEDGRITSRSLSTGTPVTESFTYTNNGGALSHTIGSDQYAYTYDDNGNIIEIKKNNVLRQSYEYDADGQLTRENNLDTNKTVVYTYDNGGNITQKQEYAYTTGSLGTATATVSYSYDSTWKDKLTNYNGQSIVYDAIGNPTTYRGATATWFGRQMQSYSKGGTSITYKYDGDGLRTQKTVNGTVYDYYYVNGQLVYEKRGNELEFFYSYDADGRLGLIKRYTTASGAIDYYYTVTNAQGDVIELRDGGGNVSVKYTYDSWGKLISTTNASGATLTSGIAVQMPFRYRGYYYDAETGLYYLQSRYYDPETGRFLNADDVDYIGASGTNVSFNAFAYCENEPVNNTDPEGTYSPSLAPKYADEWWCSYNPNYKKNSADCANFVSQCLYAGGLSKMTLTWYHKRILGKTFISNNWGKAKKIYEWLLSKKYIRIEFVLYSETYLNKVIKKYFLNKPLCIAVIFFDWQNDGKVDHAALSGEVVSSKSNYEMYYYAHTNMRSGRKMLYYPRTGKPYYAPINNEFKNGTAIHICLIKY